jgi:phage-related protein
MIHILKQCQKEIQEFPDEIRNDMADLLAQLDVGIKLSLALSRPMPSIGKGVHELRLKDAFKNIELSKKRLKEVL